jgi:hypothetical protein
MSEISGKQFGLIIAYVLPGFIALAGLSPLFPAVARWLWPVTQGDLGLGAPLYAVLAAMTIGLVLSCFRWVLIDHVHEWTGVKRPTWDDRQLPDVLSAFDYVVQNHYRYYEFTANTLLALIFAYGLNRSLGTLPFLGTGTDLGMLLIVVVLFAASRDALAKYYLRTGRLVGPIAEKEHRGPIMHNGNDHGGTGGTSSKPKPDSKPVQESNPPAKPQSADDKGAQQSK